MKLLNAIAIVAAAMGISCCAQAGEKQHLFIVSGQSNMYHMKGGEFNEAVKKAFGEENVTVVRSAQTGAAIRFWDKDYEWPENRGIPQGRQRPGKERITREAYVARFGELYDKLISAVKERTTGKTYDTVTFVWMQGESDSDEMGVEQYFRSFNRVVDRLKADLKTDSINIVIGRLSDKGMDSPTWVRLRELQVKYAEDHPNCEWVNTDDLNDTKKADGTVHNDLHYTEEGYKTLGQRFAEQAIALIKAGNSK